MQEFYFIMVWVVFSLVSIVAVVLLILFFSYLKRSGYSRKEIEDIKKKVNYMNNLFQEHFKVTDQTILDTRKERDFWKEKALKAELKKS